MPNDNDRPIANTLQTDGSMPYPQAYAKCAANIGACEQGVSGEKMGNPVLRLTWQVSEKNKQAIYNDRALRLRGHAMGSLTDPNAASVIWNTPAFTTDPATAPPPIRIPAVMLELPREEVYSPIHYCIYRMLASSCLDEVQSLLRLPRPLSLAASQSLVYR